MLKQNEMAQKLETVFERQQAVLLSEVITEAYNDLVKTGDFNELKAIVKDLAEAQRRTEQRLEELAGAQRRTEQRLEELAGAQSRTEQRVGELAGAQKDLVGAQRRTEQALQLLAQGLADTRAEVGGLSRSVSYALENEAYRALPAFLKERYGITVTERLIRTEVDGEEIDFFGRAVRDGESVLIVGEAKLQLDERRDARRGEEAVLASLSGRWPLCRRLIRG